MRRMVICLLIAALCIACMGAAPAGERVTGETAEPRALVYLGEFTVTAYCPCELCCGKAEGDPGYGITASGTKAAQGRTVAVDPTVMPYGTVIYIDGAAYVAEDCGGFTGNHIDVYFSSHADAAAFGRQTCQVCITGGR